MNSPPANGHLGCVHFLAAVHVDVFSALLGMYLAVESLDHILLRRLWTALHSPPAVYAGCFSTSSPVLTVCLIVCTHPSGYKVVVFVV